MPDAEPPLSVRFRETPVTPPPLPLTLATPAQTPEALAQTLNDASIWGAPPAQYDAVDLPPRPEPEDAAALLERTDAGVDHQAAFAILKYMMADADYRAAVLARVP